IRKGFQQVFSNRWFATARPDQSQPAVRKDRSRRRLPRCACLSCGCRTVTAHFEPKFYSCEVLAGPEGKRTYLADDANTSLAEANIQAQSPVGTAGNTKIHQHPPGGGRAGSRSRISTPSRQKWPVRGISSAHCSFMLRVPS